MSTQNLSISVNSSNHEGFLSGIIASIRGHIVASRAQTQLERLTDHELEDIGITRSQIPYVVRDHVEAYR